MIPDDMKRVFKDDKLNADFERDGYVVVDLLNSDEVATLFEQYHALQHNYSAGTTFITSLAIDPDSNYRYNVSAIVVNAFSRPVEELFDDHKLFFGHFLMKYRSQDQGYDGRVPLHQDAALVDESQYCSINIWCAITDTNEKNGTLQVVKGSHKINNYPRAYGQGFNEAFPYAEFEGLLREKYLTTIPLKAGQAIIATTKLLHASQPNTTDVPRMAASGLVSHAESQLRYYHFNPRESKAIEVFEVDADYYLGTPMYSDPGESGYKKIDSFPLGFDKISREELIALLNTAAGREEKEDLHIYLPDALNHWHQLAIDGLLYLLQQASGDFEESKHKMFFPAEQGFLSGQEWQEGDIFQRALISDTLIDCNVWMNGQLTPVIEEEIGYLISKTRKDEIGGWAYFPDLPELPADTDDLAQIMQLLIRTGNTDLLKQHCDTSLKVVLSEQLYSDGSMGTWILPGTAETELQKMQQRWVTNAWGTGTDAEVVANMVYALHQYNREKYATIIAEASKYLVKAMKTEGYWESSWYFGPYYGTYVCLRALLSTDEDIDIMSIYNFIKTSALENGTWGLNGNSDPLQTSLALLCLYYIYDSGKMPIDYVLLQKTYNYFVRIKNSEEPFPESPFIKMALGRAKNNITHIAEYGSRTITLNYVTKACSCISSLFMR